MLVLVEGLAGQGVSDSLAGRSTILSLDPLSLAEIRGALPDFGLTSAIVRGGYPELYADLTLDPKSYYRSYVTSYLERDVRAILNVTQLRGFERFLRACALRSGQILNKSDLARDVGVSPSTANQWLSVLQASNQIALLEPWFSNRTKSMVKSPKLYLCDTGVLLFLLNIDSAAALGDSPLAGHVWETFCFNEVRKHLTLTGEREALYYWRDRVREVDFLIHRGGRYELYDAKWTEAPSPSQGAALQEVCGILGADAVTRMGFLTKAEHTEYTLLTRIDG